VRSILRRAWADRPPRPAADDVRAAAVLSCVCRRVRALLREWPLPLALDFSAEPSSDAQRGWLLDAAQAGRVAAASFHRRDALWEQPLLGDLLARHGGTLLRLSGVPHKLVACSGQDEQPALDLSGLRLTRLSINCRGAQDLRRLDGSAHLWLRPERLPGPLEALHLSGLKGSLEGLAWAPPSGAGSAGRLPRLRTLRVTCLRGVESMNIYRVPLLEGSAGLPDLKVYASGASVAVHVAMFEQVGSLRIVGGRCVLVVGSRESRMATFLDCLCPAGLRAAELGAEAIGVYLGPAPPQYESWMCAAVVHGMTSAPEQRFAVEVGVSEWRPGDDVVRKTAPCRLAWRRWPAPGAPDLLAARAAHERARAWARDTGAASGRTG